MNEMTKKLQDRNDDARLYEDATLVPEAGNFTGEISRAAAGVAPVLDPVEVAQQFIMHRATSVQEQVSGSIVLAGGVSAFRDDAEKYKAFLEELRAANVLSEAEVRKGLAAESPAEISKHRKIAEHSDIIRDPLIVRRLNSGYSVVYELALLYESLARHHQDHAVDQLHAIVLEHDGRISRKWLKAERTRLNSPKIEVPVAEAKREAIHGEVIEDGGSADEMTESYEGRSGDSANSPEPVRIEAPDRERDGAAETAVPTNDNRHIAAIFMSPSVEDINRLMFNSPALGESLPMWMTLGASVGHDAVLLVRTTMAEMPFVGSAALKLGFSQCAGLYVSPGGTQSNVAHKSGLAMFLRGEVTIHADLSSVVDAANPIAAVNKALGGLKGRRVNLFAVEKAKGRWESVLGEENWATEEPN